jgi:F420-non-reducing hydrogenase small subunit
VLDLPVFFDTVKTLPEIVEVDYFLPGCPPESHQIWNVVEAVMQGQPLPPRSSVLGAGGAAVCHECAREKSAKSIAAFRRTFEIVPDRRQCLLEQGLVCMGPATREGCGALCPQVNMPCSGCYGPAAAVADAGGKMLSALCSVLNVGDYSGLTEDQVAQKTDAILEAVPDPAGTFYQYSLAGSLLKRSLP